MIRPGEVVVTGMGTVSSIGHNATQFARSLKQGKVGAALLGSDLVPPIAAAVGYPIEGFSFEDCLLQSGAHPEQMARQARKSLRGATCFMGCSIAAALEAWDQAGLYEAEIAPDRVGLVIAGSNLNQNFHYQTQEKFQNAPEYLNPRYALQYMDTDYLGTVSELLKIQGEGFTAGGASASGNVAILKGFQLIQLGLVDACLVLAPPSSLSPLELQGFHNIGALGGRLFADRPDKACRPFDRDHEGFIHGEASGCLVLEDKRCAEARGRAALAEILGGAIVLDGNRLSDPGLEAEIRAMESALARSGVTAGEIAYLNAHGSSSPLGDDTEVQAFRRVFGESLPELWINSTKGLTGHCLSSAGVIEAIATIIQMRQGFVHPSINLEHPVDGACRFSGAAATETSIATAMSNSFGFGGINTSIVFKKGAS